MKKKKKYSRVTDVKRPISEGIDPSRLLKSRSLHEKKIKKSITKNKSKILL